jgi:hypothetical protein
MGKPFAALAVSMLAVCLAACGGGEEQATQAASGGASDQSVSGKVALKPCDTDELLEPAGHDVFVAGIPCKEVGLPPITGSYVASKADPYVRFEWGGWTCWQRLIEGGFTTDNVCWRGSQVVAFQFSG